MSLETALPPVFAALGDEMRWQLLVRLGQGQASASSLAREFPISRQAIVKHVEVLREAGLVKSEQRGREVVHRALGGRLSDVAREMDRIGRSWERSLARVKELAESSPDDRTLSER
ncbi:ArsR/SmtB family transcription factor [Aeromicrobium sp.]|uniref:ArsR/SmtB family transcription factor n=1 Tax=Aeromicrobium sp. TaxID=1871063 RepID=UPI003C4F16E0